MAGVNRKLRGAIEAGGTKWVCAVGTDGGGILEERVVATQNPDETLPEVFAAFDDLQGRYGKIEALGIATFGPVALDPDSPKYGTILTSPKEAWRGFDCVAAMKGHFGKDLPVVVETDVNAAALAESRQEKNRDARSLVYVTVGTGIGAGVIADGRIWHGRMHPEMGHLVVPESPREPEPGFSSCPFHLSCVEGKASGTAMTERWGMRPQELPGGHPGWQLEADYLAALVISLTAAFSPDRIVLGGGVMLFEPLLAMVQMKVPGLAGGYWDLPPMADYLVPSSLHDRAGLVGALALADGS